MHPDEDGSWGSACKMCMQEDMSRAHDGAMPAASHHVNGQRREAQVRTSVLPAQLCT